MDFLLQKKELSEHSRLDRGDSAAVISALATQGRQSGRFDIRDSTIWSYAVGLAELLEAAKNDPENFALDAYVKSAIDLLDVETACAFLDAFDALERAVAPAAGASAGGQHIEERWPPEAITIFLELGLSPAVETAWLDGYRALTGDAHKRFADDIMKIAPLKDALFHQLAHIGAVSGWYSPSSLIKSYSFEEMLDIIESGSGYETLRMARAMVEQLNSDNKKEAARLAGRLLCWSDLPGRFNFTWDEAFLFSLILHLAYGSFSVSGETYQKLLLSNYFYRALELGVPADDALRSALAETLTAFSYVLANKMYGDELEKNIEVATVGAQPGETNRTLGMMIGAYLNFVKDDWASPDKIAEFAASVGVAGGGRHLRRALEIYIHLKNADLVENNAGSELSEEELYNNDTVLLLTWFGLGDIGAEPLAGYFKQAEPRVPLSAFVEKLRTVADISQETNLSNIFDFTALLHQNGWLAENEELVVFYEADGKFHWNESVKII